VDSTALESAPRSDLNPIGRRRYLTGETTLNPLLESNMITVKDRLIALAETESERKLVAAWMDESRNELCARQRAWQEIDSRRERGAARFRW